MDRMQRQLTTVLLKYKQMLMARVTFLEIFPLSKLNPIYSKINIGPVIRGLHRTHCR